MVFWMCASQTMDLSFLHWEEEFKAFSHKWQFEHDIFIKVSPKQQEAEQAIKAAKNLINKAKKAGADPYL